MIYIILYEQFDLSTNKRWTISLKERKLFAVNSEGDRRDETCSVSEDGYQLCAR